MKVLPVVGVGLLTVALGTPALAFFGVPTPVVDVGPIEQGLWSNQLVQQTITAVKDAQSVLNQYTMLKNEATNLSSIGQMAHQAVTGEVQKIMNRQAPPQKVGDVAAQQVGVDATNAANNVQIINGTAVGADGAQQEAQTSNLYLSSIATQQVEANALAAQEQQQKANNTTAEAQGLQTYFGGATLPTGADTP